MNQPVALEDNEDDLSDIFGQDTQYKAPSQRKEKNFSAWHRPRKQCVREEQWCAEISTLADAINFDGRPLRYIGLPGNELFDLRTIHELICKPRELRLKFLGFNNASGVENDDGFELELSTVEVRALDRVDGISKVMPDDFKSLGTPNSMAWNNAQRFGHFDVVNVDLCDGLFTAKPAATSESYYNAIKELINMQGGRGEPWLLFLTTRVGDKVVHPNTIDKLKTLIDNNLAQCANFSAMTTRHLQFSTMADVEKMLKDTKGFSDVFCTGIAKWLISLGLSATPMWKVCLRSVWNYTVYPESTHPDLLSFAFEFSPVRLPVQDNAGLAAKSKNKTAKAPTECALAADAVPAVANVLDLDRHLSGDVGLREKYVEKSASLYEKARYPNGEYRKWLEENDY